MPAAPVHHTPVDKTARSVTPVAPGDVTSDPNAAPAAGELPFYQPIPYRVDAGEDVTCPECQLNNDTDATFCDQCGTELADRDDVTVAGETPDGPYSPEPYDPEADETVQCPDCEKRNDPDARFCDQCGSGLEGRTDVNVDGPYEQVDNVDGDSYANGESQASEPDAGVENVDDDSHRSRHKRSGPPSASIVRARYGAGCHLRQAADGSAGTTLYGHFSVFNSWYPVDSYWEGTFVESVASSAFDRTMVDDRAAMKVLYDHGFDPQLGNKPLGPIQTLRADEIGAYYEVPLLDTDYNRDFVLPALQGRLMSGEQVGSQLGASFRFIVLDETWESKPQPSEFNPQGLPQRTITRAQVLEFGPVTFPASPGATSGVRSGTDRFIHHLRNDPLFLARFTERAGYKVVERILSAAPADGRRPGIAPHAAEPEDLRAAERRSFSLRARLMLADRT